MFWILMTGSSSEPDVVSKESWVENSPNRRLLVYTLLVMLLSHLWAPQGATGASPGSFKRRISGGNGKSLAEWDDIFQQRSDEDWRVLWHKEKHRRCQHQLLSHMELVCEKDIYKLARRKRKKRDLSSGDAGEFGSDDSTTLDQQEDADGGGMDALSDSENGESRFFPTASVPNVTSRSPRPKLSNHPLFSTFKEANLFGRRQLFKTRKRQLSGEHNRYSGSYMPIGTKRSPHRIERAKRGISDECCSGPDGCSWEEYAEYCPANVRVRIAN